jgi:hypothetical protein
MTAEQRPAGSPASTGGQFAARTHAEGELQGDLVPQIEGNDFFDDDGNELSGVKWSGPECWTAAVAFEGRLHVGVIYDLEADPSDPDSDPSYSEPGSDKGDPLIVAFDENGDVLEGGPSSFSLHAIPGMTEHLASLTNDEGTYFTLRESTYSAAGGDIAQVDGYVGDVRVFRSTHSPITGLVDLTVYDMDGNPVPVDRQRTRTLGALHRDDDAPDQLLRFDHNEYVGKVRTVGPGGTVIDMIDRNGDRLLTTVDFEELRSVSDELPRWYTDRS